MLFALRVINFSDSAFLKLLDTCNFCYRLFESFSLLPIKSKSKPTLAPDPNPDPDPELTLNGDCDIEISVIVFDSRSGLPLRLKQLFRRGDRVFRSNDSKAYPIEQVFKLAINDRGPRLARRRANWRRPEGQEALLIRES